MDNNTEQFSAELAQMGDPSDGYVQKWIVFLFAKSVQDIFPTLTQHYYEQVFIFSKLDLWLFGIT